MEKPENSTIVIFGASGDLTKRKLMPALFDLYVRGELADDFAVLGTSRSAFTDDSFREKMNSDLDQFYQKNKISKRQKREFLQHIYYQTADLTQKSEFVALKEKLLQVDAQAKTRGNFIFYLSTSPSLFAVIAENLGEIGLAKPDDENGWRRIVLEKPFGFDLQSARELNRKLQKIFLEDQIYRIDHYLGKETVQNILAFRFANGIFEPLWNRNYIHHVEVTAAESIGVEKRGKYYEKSGALRDMVQNHLLQVVATIAMEPPIKFDATDVRNEKVKVFHALRPMGEKEVEKYVIRGQYLASIIKGEAISGYREEENVDPNSRTETFVAMKFFIDNWRWGDVPFYIRTGKRLPDRVSEVVIHFKKTPHFLFQSQRSHENGDNFLIIRIQPDEGIVLRFGMKVPGAGFKIKTVDMDFHYSDLGGDTKLPDAYERLLLDCMLGDATLYARADAVDACWEFIMPILRAWQKNPDIKLFGYPSGTWGPEETRKLIEGPHVDWHYPCANLSQDTGHCEL
ncbi:MAG: glucose-6-phosphate dehydrogenase [Calditrichaeota bacterium]|nr:glucose-6-phosphate dehydrogenase [Calditrichota bacterium]